MLLQIYKMPILLAEGNTSYEACKNYDNLMKSLEMLSWNS